MNIESTINPKSQSVDCRIENWYFNNQLKMTILTPITRAIAFGFEVSFF